MLDDRDVSQICQETCQEICYKEMPILYRMHGTSLTLVRTKPNAKNANPVLILLSAANLFLAILTDLFHTAAGHLNILL